MCIFHKKEMHFYSWIYLNINALKFFAMNKTIKKNLVFKGNGYQNSCMPIIKNQQNEINGH